jgi:hypothetical protein
VPGSRPVTFGVATLQHVQSAGELDDDGLLGTHELSEFGLIPQKRALEDERRARAVELAGDCELDGERSLTDIRAAAEVVHQVLFSTSFEITGRPSSLPR